jgi:hypothetical protein
MHKIAVVAEFSAMNFPTSFMSDICIAFFGVWGAGECVEGELGCGEVGELDIWEECEEGELVGEFWERGEWAELGEFGGKGEYWVFIEWEISLGKTGG